MAKNTGKELAISVEDGVKGIVDKPMQADLLATVKAIKTFDDGVKAINRYSGFGRTAWVMSALVVHKTFQTVTEKEAGAMVRKFQIDLAYSRAQIYNYRKAGRLLLEGIMSGEITDIAKLPADMSDFIRPKSKKQVKEDFNLVIDETIGEITMTMGVYHVYRCHIQGDKETVKIVTFKEKWLEDIIEVKHVVLDGKQSVHYFNGVESYEDDDGEKHEKLREIALVVLPL